MELQLDKNRNRVKYCPCGKNNRDGKFVPYIGHDLFGYCHSCDKTLRPEQGTLTDSSKIKFTPRKIEPGCRIIKDDIERVFDDNMQGSYSRFLLNKWGEQWAEQMAETYFLGVHDTAAVFWYIDMDKAVRSAKIQRYDSDGHRDQQRNPTWWHSLNNMPCKLEVCFFGEHLIHEVDKKIAVVESEATAIEMSKCNEGFVWLSSGGKSFFNKIAHRLSDFSSEVTLFPDNDAYDLWKPIADKYGYAISRDCENWYDQGEIEKGGDIRDYYHKIAEQVEPLEADIVKIDPEWNDWLDENPILKKEWNLTYNNYQR